MTNGTLGDWLAILLLVVQALLILLGIYFP